MGFLRKSLLIGTAGLAPVKANSKKERTAKAAEKQVRLQQKALRQQHARVPAAAAVATSGVSVELERLASLHDSGALGDEEFAAAKQRVLQAG